MNPEYPVYIISKGRAKNCLTARELKAMNVPFRLVVEPQEADEYRAVSDNLLVLPFSNLGQGSIPARNFVWDHSVSKGHKRHWILDDNIEGFHRLNKNEKPKVTSGTIFKCAEDFTVRVFVSGFALHNAQFKGQMLMAKLAQIPCYALVPVKLVGTKFETLKKRI